MDMMAALTPMTRRMLRIAQPHAASFSQMATTSRIISALLLLMGQQKVLYI